MGCCWAAQLLEVQLPIPGAGRWMMHTGVPSMLGFAESWSRGSVWPCLGRAVWRRRTWDEIQVGWCLCVPPCCSSDRPLAQLSICPLPLQLPWAGCSIQRGGGGWSSAPGCGEQTALSLPCQANRYRRVAQNKQKRLNAAAWREQVQWNHFKLCTQEHFTSEPLKNNWGKEKVAQLMYQLQCKCLKQVTF